MASKKRELSSGSMTMDEMRAVLTDSIQQIREGKTTAAVVNAISNASGKILSTIKLEMEYYRLTGKTPNIPILMRADSVDPKAIEKP